MQYLRVSPCTVAYLVAVNKPRALTLLGVCGQGRQRSTPVGFPWQRFALCKPHRRAWDGTQPPELGWTAIWTRVAAVSKASLNFTVTRCHRELGTELSAEVIALGTDCLGLRRKTTPQISNQRKSQKRRKKNPKPANPNHWFIEN